MAQMIDLIGRSERIRTSGPCLPKTAPDAIFGLYSRFTPHLNTVQRRLDALKLGITKEWGAA